VQKHMRILLRLIIVVIAMAVPTWLLFGPIGGFHHMLLFGVFHYMFWNGEDPTRIDLRLGEETFEVLIDPIGLMVTAAVWLLIFGVVLGVTWFLTKPAEVA